ncbi:hypothetical protein [Algoriphagus machipongonensis]|uniref:Uncharacterized protein n=1 Tax=Algoriphagus machipongonensis TaxID=388413 RepID=A3HS84_9BACT|nr:hypothetical protein [Algoriphagus machipongonensis]EAZ82702.1 hypothetical protein ALPR1_10815 [Algoriphagus machipongonensis]
MEKISLQELQFVIEESLFLTEEDKKSYQSNIHSAPESVEETVQEEPTTYVQEEQEEKAEITPIEVQGNYSNGLLILHEEEQVKSELMEMLVNMMNAVGKSMNEVGLLSSSKLEGKTLEDFNALNGHIILKFGRIQHPINSVPAIPYEVYTENETQYLFADSLSQISEDKNLKIKLWKSLQILFNIKK